MCCKVGMIGNEKITADTDISKLLDLKKVDAILNKAYNKVTKELHNRVDDIDVELNRGLSREAFSVNGCEKLYDSAITAKTSQEIAVVSFENLVNSVKVEASKKRAEEIVDLKKAINKKIADLQAIIYGIEYNTGIYNQSCGAMGGDPKSYSDFDKNYDKYVTQKATYEKRLEMVNGLVGGE